MGDGPATFRGLGALLHGGVVAWSRSHLSATSRPVQRVPVRRDAVALPPGVTPKVVEILAGMAMTVTVEAGL